MSDGQKIRFRFPGAESLPERSRAHGPTTRGGAAEPHPLLAGVTVQRHFDLSPSQRAAGRTASSPPLEDNDVLALEMEGGFVLYTSAGRLADDLKRIDPAAERDGELDLEVLRRQAPETRGLGDWVVRGLSVLGLDETWLVGQAVEQAKKWGGDALTQGASWAGTKAIMWAIEKQLEREPGLYAWREDSPAGDLLASAPAVFGDGDRDAPILVFIHGTGSSTSGSFGAFRGPDAGREWLALREKFKDHIYGFEHRTFSESPIENALALANALPAGARLSVVSHSRGGLVGDLVCAAGYEAGIIESSFHRPDPRLATANEYDRTKLGELAARLSERKFQIERYVRVASPAQGTLLASSHLDAFLSGLLHLIGLVPGLAGSPYYAVVKRVLLQIAKNRTDPRLVPGIEAMLPDSPLAALVGRAAPKPGAHIAVVAGDIEGGGVLKRLGVFLTDYFLFEEENNDLVVDTESMFGGIARDQGRYVFDQGEDVSHFRYFANARTRRALQDWLTSDAVTALDDFQTIRPSDPPQPMRRGVGDITGDRPTVIVLPGIMGSHLARGADGKKDRLWFDFVDLARGKLGEIAYDRPNIAPDGIFRLFYGGLCDHLAATHDVVIFDYDWRQPLMDTAELLTQTVEETLARTAASKQPVRLMTHSLGGLVTRAMIAKHPGVWKNLVGRPGSRWVMLGTPNSGSHGAVESLLGLSGTTRKLALLHPPMGLQAVLDLMAGFPGALSLLPRPGFRDTGDVRHDYYDERFWTEFRRGNDSPWFGKNLGAIPAATLLAAAKQTWELLTEDLPDPDRISYVAGYGHETPCGIERAEGTRRLRMIATLNGDGTVTHASGVLDVLKRNERVWYMPADHAGLVASPEHFPALVELLDRGDTGRLPQERPALRGAEQPFRYEPGPVLYPTAQELERMVIGGRRPARRPARTRQTLSVCCRAMDLRHAVYPILVGHYEGDAISGAEAQIDRYVLDNRLTLRHHLDAYAGPPGTVAIVLDQQNEGQAALGVRRGAVVVGLGQLGNLTVNGLRAAVTHGVLQYLLQLRDLNAAEAQSIGLTSLLLGYNSTTHISVQDSVSAVILAVMEANRRFADTSGSELRVTRLEFVELFEDVAISAAKAVREAAQRLERDAERLGVRLDPAQVLDCSEGMRPRLEAVPASFGYWPRMIVSAVQPDGTAAPEPKPGEPVIASGLRYLLLSMRARAEAIEQQRQPGLIEALVDKSVRLPRYQRDLSRALFHLLVPNEFKDAARQTDNLVLVVDGYTANLPWEMLVADDEPLVKNTAVVRQLASSRFRALVRSSQKKVAYVIGNPSTAGYYTAFPRSAPVAAAPVAATPAETPSADALPDLPGAALEARAVADLLKSQGYDVTEAPPGTEAVDVINKLYEKPYRILHVSAHGVFQAGSGPRQRTGVVLSDGLLLTAAEIGALEQIPDLVFLNCCYTGRLDAGPETAFNRLAYSVARELIESGVRVVIAAGWAVDDAAARHFAERFYQSLLRDQRPFGKAVHEARLATYQSFPDSTTWGAFQAYGEPSFVMAPESLPLGGPDDFHPVALQELIARIDLLRNELAYQRTRGDRASAQLGKTVDRLLRRGAGAAWSDDPEVLYALGRLYGDVGDFERARENYERAIALDDKRRQVPVIAIEQLANLEARHGTRLAEGDGAARTRGKALIEKAITRLHALVNAAGGGGDSAGGPVNAERCALLGSAYKRLATIVPDWQSRRVALQDAVGWYGRGEQDPDRQGFSAYNTHNRLALEAVLGTANPADAELAKRAGEVAGRRYARSRDYFDAVMLADGYLIAALIAGRLGTAPEADWTAQEVVERYRDLRTKLPESARWLDSVVSQIDLLSRFYETPDRPGTGSAVAAHLRAIAAALGTPDSRTQAGIRDRGTSLQAGARDLGMSPFTSGDLTLEQNRQLEDEARRAGADPIEFLALLRRYRDLAAWDDVIRVADHMAPSVAQSPEVRQLLARALNHRAAPGDQDRAIALMEQLIADTGGDADAFGTLGRIYKERFEAARSTNDLVAAESLDRALKWYRAGFDKNPTDTYTGFNLVRLLVQRQDSSMYAVLEAFLPRIRGPLKERIATNRADMRDVALNMKLAAVAGDWDEAEAAARELVEKAELGRLVDAARRDLRELSAWLPAARSHMDTLQEILRSAAGAEPSDA